MNHDGKVSAQEWQQARPILEPLLRDTLVVRGNDGTTGMTEIGFQLDENDNFHVAGNVRCSRARSLPWSRRYSSSSLAGIGNSLAC